MEKIKNNWKCNECGDKFFANNPSFCPQCKSSSFKNLDGVHKKEAREKKEKEAK